MTSLHYILIALGVAFVAALALYNHLQERRYRKQVERIFNQSKDDVSLGDVPFPDLISDVSDLRIEPSLTLGEGDDPAPAPARPEELAAMAAGEPRWRLLDRDEENAAADGPPEADTPPAGEATGGEPPLRRSEHAAGEYPRVEPESPLDGGIEYVARLRYAHPGPLSYAPLLDALRRISKPIRMVGRLADGSWEAVQSQSAGDYGTVELGLLLADRAGPVSEVQLETFCARLYDFVAAHGGAVSCPDKLAALQQANELDDFCGKVDVLIVLNVIAPAGAPFSGEAIRELAQRAGLTPRDDGGYGLHDTSGRLLYALVGREDAPLSGEIPGQRLRAVSLQFDAPRVREGLRVFERMTDFGLELARALGGSLVDDAGRPVTHESLDKDRRRLDELYARMDERGIPAGGERALRLFA